MIQKALGLLFLGFGILLFQQTSAQSLPHPDHIIVLIEENQPNSFVIGNSTAAPYINQIAADTFATVFTKMYAIEHPSQPDYLDLFSGSNQGVLDDNLPINYPYTTPNLARELLDKGLTFVTYSEDLPFAGDDEVSHNSYVRKHNPVTNWVGTGTNQVPSTLNQPFTAFPTDFSQLPTICYVVPNEDSDMHNGFGNPTIKAGDVWFKNNLKDLIDWVSNPANNSLFIYTFDEDDGLAANNIPTVFYGPMVKGEHNSSQYNLFSMLRTMEDIYGLGYAGAASTTLPILDCWRTTTSTGVSSVQGIAPVKVYPNPASSTIQFSSEALSTAGNTITITDITGRFVASFASTGANKLSVNVADYAPGLYFYNLVNTTGTLQSGKFIVTR